MLEALEVVFCALEMLEGMRRVLFCTLGAGECELCLLEVLEVIRRVMLCTLEAMEGGLCLLELLVAPEVREDVGVWTWR